MKECTLKWGDKDGTVSFISVNSGKHLNQTDLFKRRDRLREPVCGNRPSVTEGTKEEG